MLIEFLQRRCLIEREIIWTKESKSFRLRKHVFVKICPFNLDVKIYPKGKDVNECEHAPEYC